MRSRLGNLCYMCHRLTGRKVFLWEWWLSGFLALLGAHGVFYAMQYTFLANSRNLSGPHLRGGICRKNVTSSNQWGHVNWYHWQRLELLRLFTKWPNPLRGYYPGEKCLLMQIFGKHESSETLTTWLNLRHYRECKKQAQLITRWPNLRNHRQCQE